jgi:hypothetical protein
MSSRYLFCCGSNSRLSLDRYEADETCQVCCARVEKSKQRRKILFNVIPKIFRDEGASQFGEGDLVILVKLVCLEAGGDMDMVMPDVLTPGGFIVLAGGWRLMSPASCDGGGKPPRMRDSIAVDESF